VEVIRVEPYGGSTVLRVGANEFSIGRDAVAVIRVAPGSGGSQRAAKEAAL
jgi:Fe2+ transport system protein FeoA